MEVEAVWRPRDEGRSVEPDGTRGVSPSRCLLCACGGGASGPESTVTHPAGKQPARGLAVRQGSASHSKPHEEAQAKQGRARDRGASSGGSAPKAKVNAASDDASPDRGAEGCPNGMSLRLCAQIAAIRQQQAANRLGRREPASAREMSREALKEVTRAYKEERGSGSCPNQANARRRCPRPSARNSPRPTSKPRSSSTAPLRRFSRSTRRATGGCPRRPLRMGARPGWLVGRGRSCSRPYGKVSRGPGDRPALFQLLLRRVLLGLGRRERD